MSDKKQQADHIWHVWLNSYNKLGGKFDHSMYDFKSTLEFVQGYGPIQIGRAFAGELPKVHRQCSRSAPEEIKKNCLKCALGKDVTKCEILVSIKAKFDEERNRECGKLGKFYADIPDSEMFRVMANTCGWHIYTAKLTDPKMRHLDTSEGYVMDEGDRMYWQRVYASLASEGE